MSINCLGCGLQYAGGRGAKGILAKPSKLLDPRFISLLFAVPRFYRAARKLLVEDVESEITWGEFLTKEKFSEYFINHYAIPVVSCVWSSGYEDALKYPARHLFEFLNHHGMLELGNSPTWKTVVGGSDNYVQAILRVIPNSKKSEAVLALRRFAEYVEVTTNKGAQSFDYEIGRAHV